MKGQTAYMALTLSEEQLEKLNKKDILKLLLESMEQEKELRSQLAVLIKELKQTNQQMQVILEKWNLAQAGRFGRSSEKMKYDTETYQQLELAVMYAECFNEAEAAVNEAPPDEPVMEEVTVFAHKRKKHAGKREEDLRGLPHAEPVISALTEEELLEKLGPGYRQLKDEVYFSLVYDWMKEELLKQPVIQADETTLKVNRDGRKAGASSYMWVYITGEHDDSGKKIILYNYCRTRSTEHLRNFLSAYQGTLVSDGYQPYHTFSEEQALASAGCWTHCRRRFVNAIKAAQKDLSEEELKNSIAYQALARISAIYKLDESWKGRSCEYRAEYRRRILKPLVDEYFDWVKEQVKTCSVPPKSETGEGLSYGIHQEKYLRTFLEDGNIPIDNSACERAIRPFCVGRKNWNVIDTVEGAQASAIAYSIAETAKANHLKPYQYFEYLLTELPKRVTQKKDSSFSLDDLMPWSSELPMSCRKIK